jgi:hypothetical protein
MVLEVAVASASHAIVTFNKHNFRGCERLGLRLLTAMELQTEVGVWIRPRRARTHPIGYGLKWPGLIGRPDRQTKLLSGLMHLLG